MASKKSKKGNVARATGEMGEALVHIGLARLKFVFHPLEKRDRGIDAVIETVDDDERTTGRYIAAQIKGGESWFDHETEEGFVFYEDREHLDFWLSNSLPVVVLVGDPRSELVYWAAVTPNSVELTERKWKLLIPRNQILNQSSKQKLVDLAASPGVAAGALVEAGVERLRELFANGSRLQALSALRRMTAGAVWRFASVEVRGAALLDLAVWSIDVEGSVAAAKSTLGQLAVIDPLIDSSIAGALIELHAKDAKAALAVLSDPATGRAHDLALLLRLATNGVEDAQLAIQSRPANVAPGPDCHRVLAFVHFMGGNRLGAIAAIEAALKETPRRWRLRHALSVLQYVSCLPTSSAATVIADIPGPVSLAIVSHDDESLKRLRAAAATFQCLAGDTDDPRLAANASAWRLACLACDPDAEDQARVLCETLLDSMQTVAMVAPWALARGIKFDVGEVVRRLETAAGAEPVHRFLRARIVLTMLSVLLATNHEAEAAKTLRKYRSLLRARDSDLPIEWQARLLSSRGDFAKATLLLKKIRSDETRRRVQQLVEEWRAEAVGTPWEEIARSHEEDYSSGGAFEHLLEALRLHLANEDWEWIDAHANQLLDNARNIYVVRAAAKAAWRLNRMERVVDVFDGWFGVSSGNEPDLRRLLIGALIAYNPRRAAQEAQELLVAAPTAPNCHLAMQAFVRVFDLKRLVIAGRALAIANDADSQTLLAAAMLTRVDEPATSRMLTMRAMGVGVSDEDVPFALMLASGLNLMQEAASLFARLPELAQRTDTVKAISPQGLTEFARQQGDRVAEAARHYFAAALPLHLAAAAFSTTLAEWISDVADDAAHGRPRTRPPLLTRFHALPSALAISPSRGCWST